MSEVTALVPIHRTEHNKEWLRQTLDSLRGIPYLLLRNDGDVEEALNAGAKQATSEFVLPFGADDVALTGMVDHLLSPSWNADVVYPSMALADERLQPFYLHNADPFCKHRLEQANYITGSSLIRRESLLKVGGYRPLGGLEDWDLFVRMSRAGMRLKPCQEAQFIYRITETGRNARARKDPDYMREMREKIVGDSADVLATFYNQATPATTYVRCQLPSRYLPGAVNPDLVSHVTDDAVEFPSHRGAAIFQFAGDKMRALTARLMVEQGIRTLVEVDDNYLVDPGKDIRKAQGWELNIGEGPHSRQGHRSIVTHADGVIVTTEWLAAQYRKVNPNVYVCPNTVDPQDWPEPEKPDDGILRIGWVASKSHQRDIPLISRALEWASRQKNVEVWCVGLNAGFKFPYVQAPWEHDLDAYRTRFQKFDISVAPIVETPHSLGRSDLKALESAMGSACPVLSDLAPYAPWTDGENCLKAQDAKGFLRAVQHLVRNPDEARELAAAARDYVLTERTTEAQIGAWRDAING